MAFWRKLTFSRMCLVGFLREARQTSVAFYNIKKKGRRVLLGCAGQLGVCKTVIQSLSVLRFHRTPISKFRRSNSDLLVDFPRPPGGIFRSEVAPARPRPVPKYHRKRPRSGATSDRKIPLGGRQTSVQTLNSDRLNFEIGVNSFRRSLGAF